MWIHCYHTKQSLLHCFRIVYWTERGNAKYSCFSIFSFFLNFHWYIEAANWHLWKLMCGFLPSVLICLKFHYVLRSQSPHPQPSVLLVCTLKLSMLFSRNHWCHVLVSIYFEYIYMYMLNSKPIYKAISEYCGNRMVVQDCYSTQVPTEYWKHHTHCSMTCIGKVGL